MTEQEVRYLSLNNLYEFFMYYGDSKIGTILENNGKFYFIKSRDIKHINAESNTFLEYGEEINLAAVSEHKNYSQPYSRIDSLYSTPKQITINANKMIILGAGASAGFSSLNEHFPKRPPLTFELFHDEYENILDEFPGAKQLSSLTGSGENLEIFFQRKWESIKKHYNPDLLIKIINTQYYLQFLFKKIFDDFKNTRRSNYNILSELISDYCVAERKQMIVTSFNYDTLFEKSLQNSKGYDYTTITDYIDQNREILLFKPHGSWNWVRYFRGYMPISNMNMNQTDKEFFSQQIYKNKVNYHELFSNLNETIDISNDLNFDNNHLNSSKTFLPQLLIPFTDKDDFVMPIEHRETLSNNLNKIDEILVIGWKGTEYVFQELLKTKIGPKPVRVFVVNMEDKSIQTTLQTALPNAQWTFHGSFSDFMEGCRKDGHPFFE